MLVENFRVGGLERLGFDDAALEALNPDLVHLAITGFGRDGPDAPKPGYDFVVQAVGGLMSITGDARRRRRPADEGGRRDQRRRDRAVRGRVGPGGPRRARAGAARAAASASTSSLLESTLAVLVNQAQNAFVGGARPGPARQRTPEPRPVRDVRDGRRRARGRASAASASGRACARRSGSRTSPRTRASPPTATASTTAPSSVRSSRPASPGGRPPTWLAALDAAEIPCGPINDIAAAFAPPQARARAMTVDVEHPVLGTVRQVGLPFRLSATPASIRTAPPLLGEHTDEILADLGYTPDDVASSATWAR